MPSFISPLCALPLLGFLLLAKKSKVFTHTKRHKTRSFFQRVGRWNFCHHCQCQKTRHKSARGMEREEMAKKYAGSSGMVAALADPTAIINIPWHKQTQPSRQNFCLLCAYYNTHRKGCLCVFGFIEFTLWNYFKNKVKLSAHSPFVNV